MILKDFLINGENVKIFALTWFEPAIFGIEANALGIRLVRRMIEHENVFVFDIISNRHRSELFYIDS